MTTLALLISARCTACGACIATCPEQALQPAARRPLADPDRCTACLGCIEVCPVDAITLGEGRG